jgi:hypothetical protein
MGVALFSTHARLDRRCRAAPGPVGARQDVEAAGGNAIHAVARGRDRRLGCPAARCAEAIKGRPLGRRFARTGGMRAGDPAIPAPGRARAGSPPSGPAGSPAGPGGRPGRHAKPWRSSPVRSLASMAAAWAWAARAWATGPTTAAKSTASICPISRYSSHRVLVGSSATSVRNPAWPCPTAHAPAPAPKVQLQARQRQLGGQAARGQGLVG